MLKQLKYWISIDYLVINHIKVHLYINIVRQFYPQGMKLLSDACSTLVDLNYYVWLSYS